MIGRNGKIMIMITVVIIVLTMMMMRVVIFSDELKNTSNAADEF